MRHRAGSNNQLVEQPSIQRLAAPGRKVFLWEKGGGDNAEGYRQYIGNLSAMTPHEDA